jgi:hypothetical protein
LRQELTDARAMEQLRHLFDATLRAHSLAAPAG